MSSVFLYVFLLSIIPSLLTSPSFSTTITIPLSPTKSPNYPSNTLQTITYIAQNTLLRAKHLKNPTKTQKPSTTALRGDSNTKLYPRSYGGYTVSLAFGTPPQEIPLVFDTGSSLLWVPCTSKYTCSNCTFSHMDPTNITTFLPKVSSSTKVIGCRNKKCEWLLGPGGGGLCPDCGPHLANCSSPCPGYLLQYGLGATAGVGISENIDLPGGNVVHDFLLGCSLLSIQQPEGIAGFGRAPSSVPNQLKLKKFSYCLLSHKFDDTTISSNLVLAGAGKDSSAREMEGVKYSYFHKNPKISPYDEYYYVSLRKITVGKNNVKVKIPYKYFTPDPNGSGGSIIDSGSTLTYMERPVFYPLVKELVAQLGHVKRAHEIEAESGFGLCLDKSTSGNVSIPEVVFHFKGGVKMELSVGNYFSIFGDLGALCLTIITDTGPVAPSLVPSGPAVIIGNYQQQNFYIEYDLEHQRIGFKKQKCG